MRTFIIFLLFAIATGISFSQTWNSLNGPPSFNNIKDIVIDITGADLFATDANYCIESSDSGANWVQLGTDVFTNTRAIASKADNSDIIIVGSSSIFKRSTNRGVSWNDIIGPGKPFSVAASRNSADYNKMYIGCKSSESPSYALYASSNAGANWSQWDLSSNVTIFDIATYPTYTGTSRDNIVVAVSNKITGKSVLWYSSNGTVTDWENSGTPTISYTTTAVAIQDTGSGYKIYLGTYNGKIYKSIGIGLPFYELTALPNVGTDTIRSIVAQNSGDIFVLSERHLYRSSNGGTNWETIDGNGIFDENLYSLAISPADDNDLYVGSTSFIYRTTDNGDTWTPVTTGGTSKFPIISTTAHNGSVVTAVDGSPYTSSYSGGNWQFTRIWRKEETFTSKSLFHNYPNASYPYIYLAGSSSNKQRLLRSTDGGSTFDSIGIGGTNTNKYYSGAASSPTSPSKIYAFGLLYSGAGKNFFYSNDNGANWSVGAVIGSATAYQITSVAMTGVADKWFAGLASDIGLYLAENDGGGPSGHGTQISSIGDKTVNAVVLNTKFNSVAYAGTEIETSVGGLWRSTNADASAGSISFTNVFNTTEVKKILIDPRFTSANDSSKYLFWVTTSDVIYYSTDRGSSWSTVTGNLPGSTVINDIYGDPVDTNAIYLATSNGLFKAQLAPKTGNLSPTSVSFVPYCVNTNFSWNAMTGATAYRIQISTSPTFAATLKDTTTSNNSYVWTGNKTCGTTYYWRVASTNGFGQSPWANQSFTASAQYPNQTAPANGATNLSNCGVTLSWSTTGCATGYYEILLAEDANFTIDLQRFDNYGSTSLALDADELDCNTTYYWKVRVDSAGQWSNTRTFSTVPCTPAAPTNIFPPNSQTLIPYCGTFNFAVSGVNAYQYTIQIASDTGFSNVVITSSDYDSVVTVTMSSLSASTTYYWRAIIYDICNSAYSAYSSRWSFTTSANFPDVPYLTTLSSPTDGYDSISVALPTTFTWSTLKYELYHRLQIDNNNDFSSPIVDTTIYFNIVNAAIQPQYSCFATYYWRVRASNCDGDGNWSSTFSFTTRCPEKIGALIENNAIPVNYSLLQNYPNPFNPVTQIQYELPEDQHVILKVYDMLGREVATLVNEYQAAGYRFAEFNAATLPSGIYIYRIQAGKFSDMKKMLLVK